MYQLSISTQETSLHRRALGAELEGPLSSHLSSLLEMQAEQSRVVESRLAEIHEQQRECERLLEGQSEGGPVTEPVSFHTSNSFHMGEGEGEGGGEGEGEKDGERDGECGRATDDDVWEDAVHDELEV